MFDTVINYIFMFFVFSAVGWTVECTYRSLGERRIINSGFLHGPFCPIYGTGVLVFQIFLVPISLPFEKRIALVLLLGMLLADTVEYITSFLMEKLFHARWWDYTGNFLNINGRICFKHTLYWAIAAFMYVYIVAPMYEYAVGFIPQRLRFISVIVIFVVFIFDLFLTVKAAADISKVMIKINELKKALNFAADAMRSGAENIKENAENKYEDFLKSMSENSEKFEEWKKNSSRQLNELRHAFDRQDGKDKKREKNTKRLMNTFSSIRNSIDSGMKDLENTWNDIKSHFNDGDDEMM